MIGITVAALYLISGIVGASLTLGTRVDSQWGFIIGLTGPFGVWWLYNYRRENKQNGYTIFQHRPIKKKVR